LLIFQLQAFDAVPETARHVASWRCRAVSFGRFLWFSVFSVSFLFLSGSARTACHMALPLRNHAFRRAPPL
jgi:hypothetical protein